MTAKDEPSREEVEEALKAADACKLNEVAFGEGDCGTGAIVLAAALRRSEQRVLDTEDLLERERKQHSQEWAALVVKHGDATRRAEKAEARVKELEAGLDQANQNHFNAECKASDIRLKAEARVKSLEEELGRTGMLRRQAEAEAGRLREALAQVSACLEGFRGHEACEEICHDTHCAVNKALSSSPAPAKAKEDE